MKTLVLAVFLVAIPYAFAVNMAGRPNNHPNAKQTTTETKNESSAALVHIDHFQACATESTANPPKWYAAFKQPDGMLVIIGFLTFIAIWLQAKEMKRATKAMKEQTDIQAAGMQQWLDIGGWGISHSPDLHYSTGQGKLIKRPEAITLEIYFKLINSTERPLTLTGIRTNVQIVGRQSANTFTINDKSIIAPKGGKLPAMIAVVLEGDEIDRYILDMLTLKIYPRVSFQDCMGKPQDQTFEQDIECSKKGGFALDKPVKRAEKETSTENES